MEFYKLEPLGGDLFADALNALQCAVIANSISGMKAAIVTAITRKRQRAKKFKPDDFRLIKLKKKKQTQTQMLQIVEMLNEAFGGTDNRQKKKGVK